MIEDMFIRTFAILGGAATAGVIIAFVAIAVNRVVQILRNVK